jgi:2-keto-4-pentenoate hydratase/2-oxohepta-3-ene-1,7-dioic acid hydratase in catechol pathway
LLNIDIRESPQARSPNPAGDGARCLIDQSAVTYLPPIERPGKFLCIGLNYRDHCAEQNKEMPKKPVVFNKFADLARRPRRMTYRCRSRVDKNVDYEAEFAVVIGKRARRVTKKTAMKHVGGYLIVNDVSLRTIQKNEPQWSRAKGFDGSGPCGPAIVTARRSPRSPQPRHQLRAERWEGGAELQHLQPGLQRRGLLILVHHAAHHAGARRHHLHRHARRRRHRTRNPQRLPERRRRRGGRASTASGRCGTAASRADGCIEV